MRSNAGIAFSIVAFLSVTPLSAQELNSPRNGGTLVYSVAVGEPETYDCHSTFGAAAILRLSPHYSTLLRYDAATYPAIVGDLAESWQVSPDRKTYQFKLRPEVQFHDGSKLTSEDIRASYERLRNPPEGVISIRQAQFSNISSIEAPDDQTVIFRLSHPSASMLAVFANPFNCIYSAKRLAADPRFPVRNVMGTGPFKFVRHIAGSEWIGERFDHYFRPGRPYLDGFRVANISDNAVGNALIGGQIQFDPRGLTPGEAERVMTASRGHFELQASNALNMRMLTFSVAHKPFDDPRIRRALSLAIDRWQGGEATAKLDIYHVAGGFQLPGSEFARTRAELEREPGFYRNIEDSRAEARRLLAEAGQSTLKAVLWSRPQFTTAGIFLIDQWRKIGVTVTQEQAENQRFFAAYNARNFDIVIDAFQGFPDDPSLQFAQFLSASTNPTNRSGVDDRVLDGLHAKIDASFDPQTRRSLVKDFESHLLTSAQSVPLFWAQRLVPIAKEVKGYIVTPSIYVGADLGDVWLAK